MPKIVDHDAYKIALAQRAAGVFSEFGFSGIGMRAIAEKLGLSKSALYHYFPTKEALFLASTEQAMGEVQGAQTDATGSVEGQLAQLFEDMQANFGAEMALVFDYLRGKTSEEIAQDTAMQKAVETYTHAVTKIVGADATPQTLKQLLGALLLDYFTGGASSHGPDANFSKSVTFPRSGH